MVADFNGDGLQDFAVADHGDFQGNGGAVSVLLGNGDGSFQPTRSFAAGRGPCSVAVGDFNGDGILDPAAANGVGNNASVLLGNGDGTFRDSHNFAAGNEPVSVAAGDFNGDGIQDLAVANSASFAGPPSISVLLGNGDGTFQTVRNVSGGSRPESVVVGDFNGDGIPDLAVADYGDFQGNLGGVSVLLGNGDGTFRPARTFPAGNRPYSMAVGDFNGDGFLDLAVADYGDFQGNLGGVSVLLGNGDGSFLPTRSFQAGSNPRAVAVGDLNGDGIVDLVVANRGTIPTNGSVSVLLGNGDGSFLPARSVNVGPYPSTVVVADVNGDGLPDLAVGAGAGVSVLLGNGDGSFQAAVNFAAGGSPLAVADFNGDGLPDLAVVGSGGVRALLGNGAGSFQTTDFSYIAGSVPAAVAVGDFNGDSWPDLAVANNYSNDVSILLNDGAWSGQHLRPDDRASRGKRSPGRSAGMPQRPTTHHPGAMIPPQLPDAALNVLRQIASARAIVDPTPACPLRDSARSTDLATLSPTPRREHSPRATRAQSPAPAPPTLLALAIADALASDSHAGRVDDRGPLPA